MTDDLRLIDARYIRLGDVGPAVRDVQVRLSRLGEGGTPGLATDAIFGPRTLAAVRLFQRTRGLAADGVVGQDTWRALTEAGHALGDRLLWWASTMMRGDDVRHLQHRLNSLGFNAGSEDGIFGRLAHAAVEEFQRNVGLPVDGIVGPDTIQALHRLHRGHQSGGLGVRARQREALRQLAGRGLVGARVLIDPARGGDDPGRTGHGGTVEAAVTWQIARRLAARLSARGAAVMLTRGPANGLAAGARARRANDMGVDLVLSIAANWHSAPVARGAASYYFGSPSFISEPGLELAHRAQDAMVDAGWAPDCGVHAMTWPILRETRMPAVVVEPGFLSAPENEAALASPARQDDLAAALTAAVVRFLHVPALRQVPVAATAAR